MKKLAKLLTAAKHTIVYTGAGMSTESGLPDFRSKSRGLWTKFNPKELANVEALIQRPEEFTAFYQQRLSEINMYQPHIGHKILAKWEASGLINGIITQNVDGFHHDAGSQNIMELHGTFRSFHCHQCRKVYGRGAYLAGTITCISCGSIIRPGIVLFGEALPERIFTKAKQASIDADLFIVLGSSLSVTPANTFPLKAKENGAALVIINYEETPFDMYADHIIQDQSIKEVLMKVHAII